MNIHHCVFKILEKKQSVMDGRTHGRTDGQRENIIYPQNKVYRGIMKKYVFNISELSKNHKMELSGYELLRF